MACTERGEPAHQPRAHHNDVSDATADLIEQQQAAAENFTDAEKPLVINLDTTQEWKSQLLRFIVHC
ncbi:MAG: hypothetical protein F6K09_29400 [Merismopedia sp. SIO2A8]|nr:hypothetical protein [Merismopedia sp. SIO2A8]